jgi:lipoprotein-releasing system permease protein
VYQALLNRRYLTSKIMPHLSIGAVALCVWMVLVTWSVMGGFLVMLLDLGRKMEGDVSITWPTVGFAHYDELIKRLEADSMVEAAAPMIETFGMVSLPDDRVKGISIRGIDARYAKVSAYSDALWWRPLQKPLPKDENNRDPRLDSRWGLKSESDLRSSFQQGLLPPPEGAFRSWDQVLSDGLNLTVNAQPAAVLGIEMTGFAKRQPEGWYKVDHLIGTRKDDGTMVWQTAFTPAQNVTVNVLPLDKKGRNFTVRSRRMPIANEFRTGFFEADKNQMFMNLGELQAMLSMDAGVRVAPVEGDPYAISGDGTNEKVPQPQVIEPAPARVTTVLVKAKPGIASEALRDRAETIYAAFANEFAGKVPAPETMRSGRGISTWERNQATFIGAVKKETALVLFLLMGISFVAVFLILAIFWSMVSEKTKDIGVLRAVGAGRAGVAWLWLRYGLSIGLVGAILGGTIAWLTITNINPIHEWMSRVLGITIWDPNVYYFSEIPKVVEPTKAAIVLGGALVFSVLGALIPALRAAYMDPVKALRFE